MLLHVPVLNFFSQQNNIPLYEYYHILFIPLFVDGHLGYIHLLAIMNNVATNTVYKLLYRYMFSYLLGMH